MRLRQLLNQVDARTMLAYEIATSRWAWFMGFGFMQDFAGWYYARKVQRIRRQLDYWAKVQDRLDGVK